MHILSTKEWQRFLVEPSYITKSNISLTILSLRVICIKWTLKSINGGFMKIFVTFLAGLLISVAANANQPLVSPTELNQQLQDNGIRILDIRDPKSYAANHIPGSISAPYGKWRGDASNLGKLPPLEKFTTLIQSLGLNPSNHIIITSSGADTTDFGASARIYWTLKVLGFENLSILNGGIKSWSEEKFPLSTIASIPPKSNYQPKLNEALIASKEELEQKVSAGNTQLIDARPKEFFEGETRHQAAKVPGTLKGANNIEHSKWFKPNSSKFITREEAQKVAAASNLNPNEETVTFCNTGHWAATDWFAISEVLGQKNTAMYPGSMVDYTQANSQPLLTNVPGRGKQLWIDLKLWWARTFA